MVKIQILVALSFYQLSPIRAMYVSKVATTEGKAHLTFTFRN